MLLYRVSGTIFSESQKKLTVYTKFVMGLYIVDTSHIGNGIPHMIHILHSFLVSLGILVIFKIVTL